MTTGGGPDLTVQSTKGTRTLKDTTVHTTLDNGVVVSTSTGTDGKPNGGAPVQWRRHGWYNNTSSTLSESGNDSCLRLCSRNGASS